jgi:hypothetical protein
VQAISKTLQAYFDADEEWGVLHRSAKREEQLSFYETEEGQAHRKAASVWMVAYWVKLFHNNYGTSKSKALALSVEFQRDPAANLYPALKLMEMARAEAEAKAAELAGPGNAPWPIKNMKDLLTEHTKLKRGEAVSLYTFKCCVVYHGCA